MVHAGKARIMMEVIRDMGVENRWLQTGGRRAQRGTRSSSAIADELFGADWADSRHYRFGASSLLASLLKAAGSRRRLKRQRLLSLICRGWRCACRLQTDACRPDKGARAVIRQFISLGGYRVSRTKLFVKNVMVRH
ncbi:hypothetical protein MJ585_04295 [Klebsiella pneumoniae]|nr:hypothetical protein MJ585_04295 [Klebsiella pneumoniae]